MKILVLNGSPKGKFSVTVQTALYLEKRYPEHEFEILNVGQRIKMYEKDFAPAKESLEKADIILFLYPVYTFLAPYQLHRFIELMKENKVNLKDKFATQITTSKHFYDVTAHKYIEENSYDFGMKYINGLSADMDDLQTEKGRREADCFFDKLTFDIKNGIYSYKEFSYKKIEDYKACLKERTKSNEKDIVIVTNASDDDSNLHNMIQDFKAISKYNVREINVRKFNFSGGCLGCLNCATTEKCIYKDGFDEFLRNQIQNANGLIYAFSIENHYTHSSLKCYDDRQFCNGHRTVTSGMPVGYIVNGDLQSEENLRFLINSRSEVGGLYLAGVCSSENNVIEQIEKLEKSFTYCLDNKMEKPMNFYGVGGTKIFRDLVYLMQGMMKADHKYYKKHGIYDFPHNNKMKLWQMKFLGSLMSRPSVQKKMKGKLSQYIIAPYVKIIENTTPKNK